MPDLTFIFVHGLSGWGSYDDSYRRMPYWGMRGGDLMAYLRGKGFSCYAASVSPAGSAWDRACELFAQIAGARTDYGRHHSEQYRHDRFGADFTGRPLIPIWTEDIRLVLLGHSFGGATIRVFSELLVNGNAGERASVPEEDLSPLFKGGMAGRLHSLITLASPMNGTTAYDMFADPSFSPDQVPVPWWSNPLQSMMARGTRLAFDDRDARDYAGYDMHLDRAREWNALLPPLPNVFYFSFPCRFTRMNADGTHSPKKGMEPLFVKRSFQIGCYTGKTAGGYPVDETWLENDGLVNTISATAPFDAPSHTLTFLPWDSGVDALDQPRPDQSAAAADRLSDIRPGIWNIFPAYDGDHMSLQGGLVHKHNIRPFYESLLCLIRNL